jgi:fermentation-respiration switch protein FrsA (DUF1100 family)
MGYYIFQTLATTSIIDELIAIPWGKLAIILFSIYIMLGVYAWLFADYILFPAPQKPSYTMDGDAFFLKSKMGNNIACKFWAPKKPNGIIIIYSHGNAEDIGKVESQLETILKDGWSIITYDYPGYGNSSSKASEYGCYDAIDTVYRYLTEKKKITPDRIVLWGRSLGTGPSCYLAEKKQVGGLILETPFISAFRTITGRSVLPWDRFRNLERAPNITCPSLVIHGKLDEIVPFKHGKQVFKALPQTKDFLEFENAGHNDLAEVGGLKYYSAVINFLENLTDD